MRYTFDGFTSFDTPEVAYWRGAQCPLEIERGKAATARVREIRKAADDFDIRPLLDDDGSIMRTEKRDRLVVRVIVDGVNLGTILIDEGHAMSYDWRTQTIDWCVTPPVRMDK